MSDAGRDRPSTRAATIRARVRSASRAAVGAMSAAVRKLAVWSTAPVCRRYVSVPTEMTARNAEGMTAMATAPVRPVRILPVMCAGMFLVLLDVTIVNVTLPSIAERLALGTGRATTDATSSPGRTESYAQDG